MYFLLKWVSVLLFLATPVSAVAGIWYSDLRFLWIMLIAFMFSAFTNSFADSLKAQDIKAKAKTATAPKNIKTSKFPDENIALDDTTWDWITKFGNKTDQ